MGRRVLHACGPALLCFKIPGRESQQPGVHHRLRAGECRGLFKVFARQFSDRPLVVHVFIQRFIVRRFVVGGVIEQNLERRILHAVVCFQRIDARQRGRQFRG
jgi:hypothetical protein